jgi:hypothetical protein
MAMRAGRWDRKELTYQGTTYGVVHAPLPSKNHQDWGVLRKMPYASGSGDGDPNRWECTVCSRAHFQISIVVCCAQNALALLPDAFVSCVCVRPGHLHAAHVRLYIRTRCSCAHVAAHCNAVWREYCVDAGKKQSCPHVEAWPAAEPGMTSDAFEEHMKEFLDPETGERRLTCVSRAVIPEHLRKGGRAADWAGGPPYILRCAVFDAPSARDLTMRSDTFQYSSLRIQGSH